MNETPLDPPEVPEAAPRWKPLSSIDRRVLGVLVEKAKTTPDAYPLSLVAITTGCNQKSNRDPLMHLEADDVEASLDRLREAGAVGLVQGLGRVSKYRHYAYQWLGVDKVELAVMAELLLRGAQTEGELRGRAARMEPIPSLSDLRPVLDSLKAKGLVLPLTPEGRGHTVSHALYTPPELEKLRAQYRAGVIPIAAPDEANPMPAFERAGPHAAARSDAPASGPRGSLEAELSRLHDMLAEIRQRVDTIAAQQRKTEEEVRNLREALGG